MLIIYHSGADFFIAGPGYHEDSQHSIEEANKIVDRSIYGLLYMCSIYTYIYICVCCFRRVIIKRHRCEYVCVYIYIYI